MTNEANAPDKQSSFAVQQEYRIIAEYKMLQSENISGTYVIPSNASPLEWFGVLFVRNGPFKGGIFRFKILLPESFSDELSSVPELLFSPDLFHPLISPQSGALNTSDAFPEWNSFENHIWQLLKYVQFVFESPELCLNSRTAQDKDAEINREALELLGENREEFNEKARQSVEESKDKLYLRPAKEDSHYIVFEKFQSGVHGPVLDSIKARTDISVSSPPTSGLSWLNSEGLFKPLSKSDKY